MSSNNSEKINIQIFLSMLTEFFEAVREKQNEIQKVINNLDNSDDAMALKPILITSLTIYKEIYEEYTLIVEMSRECIDNQKGC